MKNILVYLGCSDLYGNADVRKHWAHNITVIEVERADGKRGPGKAGQHNSRLFML